MKKHNKILTTKMLSDDQVEELGTKLEKMKEVYSWETEEYIEDEEEK